MGVYVIFCGRSPHIRYFATSSPICVINRWRPKSFASCPRRSRRYWPMRQCPTFLPSRGNLLRILRDLRIKSPAESPHQVNPLAKGRKMKMRLAATALCCHCHFFWGQRGGESASHSGRSRFGCRVDWWQYIWGTAIENCPCYAAWLSIKLFCVEHRPGCDHRRRRHGRTF